VSGVVSTGVVLEAFREMLESQMPSGIKVGHGKAPDDHGDGYALVYASTTASREEGSFANPEGSGRVRVQITTAGVSDEQANAIMDACLAATFETGPGTGFSNDIVAAGHEVWFRSKVADVGSANEGPTFQRTFLIDLSVSRL
jgi:hypothetical protein